MKTWGSPTSSRLYMPVYTSIEKVLKACLVGSYGILQLYEGVICSDANTF